MSTRATRLHIPRNKTHTYCGRKLSGQQTGFEWTVQCEVCKRAERKAKLHAHTH